MEGEEVKSEAELAAILAQFEDVDSAIAVYKEANAAIAQFEEIKKAALSLAENELRSTGEVAKRTAVGSCGWTQPKTPQLDKTAWEAAISENPELSAYEVNFNRAEKLLKKAQEPFMKLPEGRFFI
jgi:phage terminase large subunit GpA-like protein